MANEILKLSCDKCAHSEICKYKKTMEDYYRHIASACQIDCDIIKRVEIQCKYQMDITTVTGATIDGTTWIR